MKKIVLLVCSLLVAATLFAQKPVKLEYKLQKGAEYFLSQKTDATITQGMRGVTFDMTQKMDMTFRYKVTAVHNDYYEMEVSYTRFVMSMSSPDGQTMTVSMDDDPTGVFSGMKDATIQLKMDKTGKVTEIMSVINSPSGPAAEYFNKENLIKTLSTADGMYSANPVSPGDKWTGTTAMELQGISMRVETEYEYTGKERKDWLIRANSKVSNDKDSVFKVGDMSVPLSLAGTVSCNYNVDAKTGWIRSSTGTMNLDGTMSIDVPNQGKVKASFIAVVTMTMSDKPM